MSWSLNDKEFESVILLEAPKRYSYWIKKVADHQQVWSLWKDGGWALAGDDQGCELTPVWPHEKFAAVCANGDWASYMPQMIEASVWLERWIPGIQRDNRLIAVFPTPADRGIVVTPERLRDDLKAELSLYE